MELPWFLSIIYTGAVALCYYIYNYHMFSYIDGLTGKALPKWKKHDLTFVINYGVFMIISQLRFYLIVNWTIFAVFLVLEIAVLYKTSWLMSLFAGVQGAMIGLAFNFITRSSIALLTNRSLVAFDAGVDNTISTLKPYPIAAGFLLAGWFFWLLRSKFGDWAKKEENPNQPVNLLFSACLVFALFLYLDLNLMIYLTPSSETIIKLWGMKSGACVLIGYYIGISHIHTLTELQYFERQSYWVRKELDSHESMEEELEKLAFYDVLTGCQSREVVRRTMAERYEQGIPFCVCFVDVNCLKAVNDNLGHDAGDRYLAAVAHALQDIAGEADVLSRYGGDEFLLLAPEDGIERVRVGIQNAQWALTALSHSSEYPFALSASYGIALSKERDSAEALMTLVDARMYESKQSKKQAQGSATEVVTGPLPAKNIRSGTAAERASGTV